MYAFYHPGREGQKQQVVSYEYVFVFITNTRKLYSHLLYTL